MCCFVLFFSVELEGVRTIHSTTVSGTVGVTIKKKNIFFGQIIKYQLSVSIRHYKTRKKKLSAGVLENLTGFPNITTLGPPDGITNNEKTMRGYCAHLKEDLFVCVKCVINILC